MSGSARTSSTRWRSTGRNRRNSIRCVSPRKIRPDGSMSMSSALTVICVERRHRIFSLAMKTEATRLYTNNLNLRMILSFVWKRLKVVRLRRLERMATNSFLTFQFAGSGVSFPDLWIEEHKDCIEF